MQNNGLFEAGLGVAMIHQFLQYIAFGSFHVKSTRTPVVHTMHTILDFDKDITFCSTIL